MRRTGLLGLWPVAILLGLLFLVNWADAGSSGLEGDNTAESRRKVPPSDAPILLGDRELFSRLSSLLPILDPPHADGRAPPRYRRLLGLAVSRDAEADGVLWVTDDCDPHETANGTVSDECAFFMQTVSTTAEVLSQPAPCSYGMGFSLDPADPSDPTGPTFVKSYYPTACADLWSDLLTGQIMFEADWDLKLLLHDLDGAASQRLGPWYRTLEQLSREEEGTVLGHELLARVWLAAEEVEVTESATSLVFHGVHLTLHAERLKRDKYSPTGLVRDGPAHNALARFVDLMNEHMDEVVDKLPSFRCLEQLVLGQEAARFLLQRGLMPPPDPRTAVLRSPLGSMMEVPSLTVERLRPVVLKGIVELGSWEEGVLKRVVGLPLEEDGGALGPASLTVSSNQTTEEESASHNGTSSAGSEPTVRRFSCRVTNGTLASLVSFEDLFGGSTTVQCTQEDRRVDGGDVNLSTEHSDIVVDEDAVRDTCPLALQLATLSYRRLQGEDEDEEEEDDEEHVVDWAPVRSGGVVKTGPAVYNVTGRVVDMEDLGKSWGGRVVQMWASPQWETQALEAQEAGAVAVVLVRERRWRNRQYWETEQPDYDEDRVVGTAKVTIPVRLVSPTERLESGSFVWLSCGLPEETPEPEEEPQDSIEREKNNVTYRGATYRTLDWARVDGARSGCQRLAYTVPDGYELVPAYADVVKHVVAAHTWSTSALLLLGTDTQQRALELPHAIYAYGTAWAGLQAGKRLDAVDILLDEETGGLRPARCEARILVRTTVMVVEYGSYEYRVMDEGVPVDAVIHKSPPQPSMTPPLGWELAPVNRGIIQRVVSQHSWACDYLVLWDGRTYPTLRSLMLGETDDPDAVRSRVLIRRLLPPISDLVDGEDYRMMDRYLAEAQLHMTMQRLPEGYLLELSGTEKVLIHGGIDLMGVRRVRPRLPLREVTDRRLRDLLARGEDEGMDRGGSNVSLVQSASLPTMSTWGIEVGNSDTQESIGPILA